MQQSWQLLSCWDLPNKNTNYKFSFETLIRGFIPSDLSKEIIKYTTKKYAYGCIASVVNAARDSIYSQIWKPRCNMFRRFEVSHHINPKDKIRPSKRLATPNRNIAPAEP